MENITSYWFRRLAVLFAFSVLIAGAAASANLFSSSAQKAESDEASLMMAGTISGRVFQDYNGNGTYDTAAGTNSIDSGVANVTVTAYDAAGINQGSATTDAAGFYSINATGTATGGYRVEFTTLPAGFSPSARSTNSVNGGSSTDSGSTTQFVTGTGNVDVNLALTRAEEYCQNNPTLIVPRYAQGASNGPFGNNAALFDFPYGAGTTYTDATEANYDNPTAHTLSVDVDEIGTINSLAYNRVTNRLYAASYFKRHAGFGPGANGTLNDADDVGAIYVINPTGAGSIVSTLTVPGATTNSHDVNDYDADNGDTGWNGTGKRSLGGMALADDNSKLFVMNLETRSLAAYTFSTSTWASSANMDGLTMNTPGGTATQCAAGGDRRPFAVRFYRGSVYIGVVCTAQSTANVNNLFAYVFSVDPGTLAINPTPVYSLDLDYPRGIGNPGLGAEWQPWTTTIQTNPGGGIWVYPQPWLTDIDFDRGNLVMGIRDRTGDAALDLTIRTAGDIIRACGSFGAWTTESNGRCGGTGTAPQGTGQGPGNGEFYHNDDFCTAPNNGNFHDEVAWGAVMQLPGRQHVITSLLDPINRQIANGATFDGGFRWMNNTSGSTERAYRLYNGTGGAGDPDFGKTNGLGDIQALCAAAPIEIGNRIWRDANNNGVQDPGEAPIAGVTVRLYQGSTLVGTAVTDANGEYYFVSSTVVDPNTTDNIGQVNGGILYNTAYQVRLDNATNFASGGPLFATFLTVLNQTSQSGDDDSSDSDASTVTNPAGSPAGSFPVISITTGGPGSNSHTFDIGFVAATTSAAVSVSGRVTLSAGNGIRNARVYLTEDDGTVHQAVTGAFGYYRFDGIESGQTVVVGVVSKRFTFTPAARLVTLGSDATEVNWVANE